MMKLTILGSTGSIGTQTLEVVASRDDIIVEALGAGRNIKLLEEQIRKFRPKKACVADEKLAEELKIRVADTETKVLSGEDGMEALAADPASDTVVAAIVGLAGLKPALAAVQAGKRLALANKETLVAAGDLVRAALKEHGGQLIPVDSEHSAVFQCLEAVASDRRQAEVKRILLTASGGPFAGKTRAELLDITPEAALKHPNWDMGAKITIDSATMMNKGFEVIEAKWLFGVRPDQIEVVVHPQSVIHSMVQFEDGAVMAQLGTPDMKLPIQYAFAYPQRLKNNYPRLDFSKYNQLTFEKPDTKKFRNLSFAYEAMKKGGNAACVLNAANEVVNLAFREGRCGFMQMSDVIAKTMEKTMFITEPTYEDYVQTDKEARKIALELLKL